ncbi:MAG: type II toxin-antitoxin system RelE/ParE family toxin [Chloroflexota bacterium]
MIIRLTPQAEDDVADARRWYRQRSKWAADRFMNAVAAALDVIGRYPEGQPILYRTARRALVSRFPYFLLYYPDGDNAVVFGCFHTARDPETWRERADIVLH